MYEKTVGTESGEQRSDVTGRQSGSEDVSQEHVCTNTRQVTRSEALYTSVNHHKRTQLSTF